LVTASKTSSLLSSITSDETLETTTDDEDDTTSDLEDDGDDGSGYAKSKDNIWQLSNKKQHAAFLANNQDKIVILKFYAPWCRACKGLAPKYRQIVNDKKYSNLPLEFAELNVQDNRDFVKSVGVLALPSVQIYCGSEGLIENFPCGPSKTPILKKKIMTIINSRVDPATRGLKQSADTDAIVEAAPCRERTIAEVDETKVGEITISKDRLAMLRSSVPYFADFNDDEWSDLLGTVKISTFEAGDVIMRQGVIGESFYMIETGEVEISVLPSFQDPFATPSNYLGAVMNTLGPDNYFGERGLITGEPRAASIKATEKTRCFVFKQEHVPASSVLSGKVKASAERISFVNNKYGADDFDDLITIVDKQTAMSSIASQSRGSVNTPDIILGVDTNDSILDDNDKIGVNDASQSDIFTLLIKFKLVRQAARCFEHIMRTKPRLGDVGEISRRSMLVSKLSIAQREEFRDVFLIIDSSKDGKISILELKRFMESVGSIKSEDELAEMINKSNPLVDGNAEITFEEFMGVMAEAEFYYLFTDTFNTLDPKQTGYVRARDLDVALCGMRDLISDDRMSIIDIDDKDMLIDYEQFSRMLLGTNL